MKKKKEKKKENNDKNPKEQKQKLKNQTNKQTCPKDLKANIQYINLVFPKKKL